MIKILEIGLRIIVEDFRTFVSDFLDFWRSEPDRRASMSLRNKIINGSLLGGLGVFFCERFKFIGIVW